jgi:phospholipid/cholesterol/gamma-HCH transport system substrate-binding protein
MTYARMARIGLATVSLSVVLSGCEWTGLNSVSLPFTQGGDDDRIEVTVQLANAANLVPNSEVKYDEVTIGSVRKIELKDWTATLTIGLEGDAHVPADVTASVAQKSLLGAEYLALSDPAAGETSTASAPARAAELLESGDVIGLERTDRYPETEEVLAAGSMLLNGGGLQEIRSIAHELNATIGGRVTDIRSFMRTVSDFTERLDRQRDNIVGTLAQLDKLSRTVVQDQDQIAHALEELPQGFDLLAKEREQLVNTLRSLDSFGKVADRVIGATKADFGESLDNLRPVTKALAENGKTLAASLDGLAFPFHVRRTNEVAFGDYINLISEIEVNAANISRDWLGGTPLDGIFNGFITGGPTGAAGDAANPLTGELLGSLGGLLDPPKPATGSTAPNDEQTGALDGLLGNLLGGR